MSIQQGVFPTGPLPGFGGTVGSQTSIGLEYAQMNALFVIKDHFKTELERQALEWNPRDLEIAKRLRQPYLECVLEIPADHNWYLGSRLGVLGLPWDQFPSIAVMVDSASPTVESASHDNSMYVYAPTLYIEMALRSDAFPKPHDGSSTRERINQEGIIDRRGKRTIEALVQCISKEPTLRGSVPELSAAQVTQTDPFLLDGVEPGDQSKQRVFSIVRVQYSIDTYVSRPNAGQPGAGVLPMEPAP